MSDTFKRDYDLEGGRGTLVLSQQEEGDVNCVVWDAALVLAKYLEIRSEKEADWLKNKRVIELGAGVGCVGLVAACYGANTTLTDQPKALSLLEKNVIENSQVLSCGQGSARVTGIDWSEGTEEPPCDILLLADCVYYKQSIVPLVNTMRQLSSQSTEIFLSQEDRSYSDVQTATWIEFRGEIEKYFDIFSVPRNQQHPEYASPDIMLLNLKKKPES